MKRTWKGRPEEKAVKCPICGTKVNGKKTCPKCGAILKS